MKSLLQDEMGVELWIKALSISVDGSGTFKNEFSLIKKIITSWYFTSNFLERTNLCTPDESGLSFY
jgi:hypothetical protein